MKACLEKFNALYAERFPNLRVGLIERHEVSYLTEFGRVQVLGDMSPDEAIRKVAGMSGQKHPWVSKEKHFLVVTNLTAQPVTHTSIRVSAVRPVSIRERNDPTAFLGVDHVYCVAQSRGAYKRLCRSFKNFLRAQPPRVASAFCRPRDFEVARPKVVTTRHELTYADGSIEVTSIPQAAMYRLTPERPLVGCRVVHELADAPNRTNQ